MRGLIALGLLMTGILAGSFGVLCDAAGMPQPWDVVTALAAGLVLSGIATWTVYRAAVKRHAGDDGA